MRYYPFVRPCPCRLSLALQIKRKTNRHQHRQKKGALLQNAEREHKGRELGPVSTIPRGERPIAELLWGPQALPLGVRVRVFIFFLKLGPELSPKLTALDLFSEPPMASLSPHCSSPPAGSAPSTPIPQPWKSLVWTLHPGDLGCPPKRVTTFQPDFTTGLLWVEPLTHL